MTGPEPGGDQVGEDQAVGVLPRPAQRADREDDGLRRRGHGRRGRADGERDEHGEQDAGGDPGREAGTADVNLGDAGMWWW